MGRPLDVDCVSWDDWADKFYSVEPCVLCGRGKEYHQPTLHEGHWSPRCYQTPVVKAVFYLWELDETGYRDPDEETDIADVGDYDGIYISCKCYVVTHFQTWDVRGEVSYQLHYFETPGLYGIVPPAPEDVGSESWESHMTEIEKEESMDMRFIMAHYGVDLESYDKCSKLRKENW